VLLERLGPWLTNARKALLEAPPFADAEDIAQQLHLEVLAKAARWLPGCEDKWIPRKLVEEAERRVRKALRRERSRQHLELDERVPAPSGDEPLVLETPIGRASAADIRLIYRYNVVGERLDEMARQAGVTPRQMRRRIQRARERASS
jgi:DNA-directed RNA polymerase specialized sigma24 family protein